MEIKEFMRGGVMRLSADQIEAIKQETAHFFGADARVWLFGSRADDAARGGDVDWSVEQRMSGNVFQSKRRNHFG